MRRFWGEVGHGVRCRIFEFLGQRTFWAESHRPVRLPELVLADPKSQPPPKIKTYIEALTRPSKLKRVLELLAGRQGQWISCAELQTATGGKQPGAFVHRLRELKFRVEMRRERPEFAGRINRIQRRLWDLLPVIRNHVYHPAFSGSFSLKAVLPALVPEMTYDGMAVANGTDAGLAWESFVRGNLDQTERERTEKALREYCGQDTLALARLLGALSSAAMS